MKYTFSFHMRNVLRMGALAIALVFLLGGATNTVYAVDTNACFVKCVAQQNGKVPNPASACAVLVQQNPSMCDGPSHTDMKSPKAMSPSTYDPRAAAASYRARFYTKCMSTYKNDSRVGACCSTQADTETASMQKKGVFDTQTSAELPVFVNEAQCSIPKQAPSSDRCVVYSGSEALACNEYIAKCLAAGKHGYQTENGRLDNCAIDFGLRREIKLTTQEKYIRICMANSASDGESEDTVRRECTAGYHYDVRDYVNRCMAMANKVEYSAVSNFILRLRGLFRPAQYNEQTKACIAKYDSAISLKLQ